MTPAWITSLPHDASSLSGLAARGLPMPVPLQDFDERGQKRHGRLAQIRFILFQASTNASCTSDPYRHGRGRTGAFCLCLV
ncbi:hypothetical protein [Reticulibacter mediterranei]|uniref:hypothetical protein n=1 Tax=Reticulibacter mediterranei TaxID=2778369 RepID=UPI001C68DE8C|nr:hypothetical protein [Reticulibacter mediterranei]